MTGLNTDKDRIMEAAVIVTDSNLDVIREGPNLVIKVDDGTLDNMNEWCKKHHGEVSLPQLMFIFIFICLTNFRN